MLSCKVCGCSSDQNTRIDGREISFFTLPEDEAKREQWLKNSKIVPDSNNEQDAIYFCELHFVKTYFSAPNELKADAVPTIFPSLEDSQKKRKSNNIVHEELPKVPRLKDKSLGEDSSSLVTPPQSPFTQLEESVDDEPCKENKEVSCEHNHSLNGFDGSTSVLHKGTSIGKKIYRLTIQIEKVCSKPISEERGTLGIIKQEVEDFMITENELSILKDKSEPNIQISEEKTRTVNKIDKKLPCIKGECKLKKAMYGTKSAFQCTECNKYYIMKRCNTQIEKTNVCSMCQKYFASPQSLYLHVKKHFVCDICLTECSSRVNLEKHVKLHVSMDPLFPYKCHQCTETFDSKDNVRNHYVLMHPLAKTENTTKSKVSTQVAQQDFSHARNEQTYTNSVNSLQKEEICCNITESSNIISVSNPLTGGQIGILRAVKFSCRVCSKEFDNVAEVDTHTRTHLESAEEHKCNVCKKSFKTVAQLNEHLKHHLSRAYPCPICPKAFINRTTLKIHLKAHGDS